MILNRNLGQRRELVALISHKHKEYTMITIYSKPNCPACIIAERMLATCGEVEVLKLDVDFTMDELTEKYPNVRAFPQVEVDGNYIGSTAEVATYIDNMKAG